MTLIGICGYAGSGKDTVANYLIKEKNFERVSFAGILKDIVSVLMGWERELLEGLTEESRIFRETKDEWWSSKMGKYITPRIVLQTIGTNVFRNHFDDNIWIFAMERKFLSMKDKNVVITDCRFENEFEFIKNLGGKILTVSGRNQMINIQRRNQIITCLGLEQHSGVHESEQKWILASEKYSDYEIINNDTLEALYAKVEKILQ